MKRPNNVPLVIIIAPISLMAGILLREIFCARQYEDPPSTGEQWTSVGAQAVVDREKYQPVAVRDDDDDDEHRPPAGFPWHRWDVEAHRPEFHKNLFDAFYKNLPNPYLRFVIRKGVLYCPEGDISGVGKHKKGAFWKGRSMRTYPVQHVIGEAIELGRSPEMMANSRVAAAMRLLLGKDETGRDHEYASVGVPLLFDRGDAIDCADQYPVFRFTRIQDAARCGSSWTFPEYSTMIDIRQRKKKWDRVFKDHQKKYPWEKKKKKAVWRGSTTGHLNLYPSWSMMPRVQVSLLSAARPDVIDAGFHKISTTQGNYNIENFTDYGLIKKGMKSEDFMKYRAVIDVDGNSWSSRLSSLLSMNSVVIKVEPAWTQYFFDELVPWKHYIPSNFSNLVETVEYVMSDDNEEKIRKIVNNAQSWAKSKLTKEQMALDVLWILVAYVETLEASSKDGGGWQKPWEAVGNRDGNPYRSLDLVEVPCVALGAGCMAEKNKV